MTELQRLIHNAKAEAIQAKKEADLNDLGDVVERLDHAIRYLREAESYTDSDLRELRDPQ